MEIKIISIQVEDVDPANAKEVYEFSRAEDGQIRIDGLGRNGKKKKLSFIKTLLKEMERIDKLLDK